MENMHQPIVSGADIYTEYDYIEYYVGMAKMFTYWHIKALGFNVVAYAGPETGVTDRYSYYLVKNNIKIVITSATQPTSYEIISLVNLHGNAVKRIAVRVKNVPDFFYNAVEKGAIPIQHPSIRSDEYGSVQSASIKIFDDNELILVNYDNYSGLFMPGYKDVRNEWTKSAEDTELQSIDHVACALRINESQLWETYLNNIFGSSTVKKFDERKKNGKKAIGMLLKVLQSKNKRMNNVLVEPDAEIKSQVQLFIDQNYGNGIQHLAFTSENIFRSVTMLKENGVKFTRFPDSYYDNLASKYPHLDIEILKKHGVLCDVLNDSLLFQIFTSPVGDRSTLFYEIVQRVNNYDGFGLDNIYALFDAMESELMTGK
jgi:4-hydroxyphenylpyruvate dioxygenase